MTDAPQQPIPKIELVGRTPRAVKVRLPDGTTRAFAGRNVVMVWCTKGDLDAQIEDRPHRQTEVSATIHDDQTLVLMGTANYI